MAIYNESERGDRKREFAGIDKKTFALIRHLKKSKKDVNLFYIKILSLSKKIFEKLNSLLASTIKVHIMPFQDLAFLDRYDTNFLNDLTGWNFSDDDDKELYNFIKVQHQHSNQANNLIHNKLALVYTIKNIDIKRHLILKIGNVIMFRAYMNVTAYYNIDKGNITYNLILNLVCKEDKVNEVIKILNATPPQRPIKREYQNTPNGLTYHLIEFALTFEYLKYEEIHNIMNQFKVSETF